MSEHSRAGAPAEGDASAAPASPPSAQPQSAELRVVPRAGDAGSAAAPPAPAAAAPAAAAPAADTPAEDSAPEWADDEPGAPWHLWAVSLLSLLWYGYGAYEYVMVQIGRGAQLPGVTQGQAAALDTSAIWFQTSWAIAVWGGVLAALAMLFRRALAGWLFALSLLGVLAISAQALLLSPDRGETGTLQTGMTLAVLGVGVFVFLYVRGVRRALR